MAETYETSLAKINNTYTPMIENQLKTNGIEMTDYQKQVVISAISAINETLNNQSLTIKDIDQSNLTQTLLDVAALQLNASASPREIYFQVRNKNIAKRGAEPRWIKAIELGIEGDGNDSLLSRFGRGVKTVYPYWLVRENDKFEYPKHVGIELTPPVWEEAGQGKVIRVVYPVEFENGQVNYYIGEREGAKNNLVAHMMNNLMKDKEKVAKKKRIREKIVGMSLDQILDDEELMDLGNVSPAWREPQSRETMIIRKMRNNVVKKIPKDFSNGFLAMRYQKVTNPDIDDTEEKVRRDVTENANQEDFEQAKIESNNNIQDYPKTIVNDDQQEPMPEPETVADEEPSVVEAEPEILPQSDDSEFTDNISSQVPF